MYRQVIKRIADLLLSSVAIIVLMLPMLMIVVATILDELGSILFEQKRVGMKKNGHTYFMI